MFLCPLHGLAQIKRAWKGTQICACGPSCLTKNLLDDKSDGGSVYNIEYGLAYMIELVDTS